MYLYGGAENRIPSRAGPNWEHLVCRLKAGPGHHTATGAIILLLRWKQHNLKFIGSVLLKTLVDCHTLARGQLKWSLLTSDSVHCVKVERSALTAKDLLEPSWMFKIDDWWLAFKPIWTQNSLSMYCIHFGIVERYVECHVDCEPSFQQ